MNELKGIVKIEAPGVVQTLNGIATNVGKTEQAFKKLAPATNQTTTTLMNFGRVVQDAPFGLIGIANNIDPLIQSFQALKTQTGSAGAAFKSLAGSLLGPAGIAIGVSAVTSLLIAFGDKLFGASQSTKDAEAAALGYEKALQRLKDAVEDLKDSLDFSNQLGALNIQISGAGDLANLRQQSIAQREFTQQVIDQQEELKKQMAATLADTKLSADKRAEIEQKQNEELRKLQKEEIESRNTQRIIYRKIELQKNKDQEEANKKAVELGKERLENLKKLTAEELKLLRARQEADPNRQVELILDFDKNASVEALKKQILFLEEKVPTLKISTVLQPMGADASRIDAMRKLSDDFQKKFSAEGFKFPIIIADGLADMNKKLTVALARVKEFKDLVSDTLTPAFTSLFSSILEGGNGLKSFLESLGDSVKQLIAKLLAAAAVAAIISVVTGGSFKNFGALFGQLSGFSNLFSGGGSGGRSAGGIANLFAGRQAIPLAINVNGQISGKNIVLSYNRTVGSQGRTF